MDVPGFAQRDRPPVRRVPKSVKHPTPGPTLSTLSTAKSSPMFPVPSIPVGTTLRPVLTGGTSPSRALSTSSRYSGTGTQALKTALGGWELSGIALFESGTPVSIGGGPDNLGYGGNTHKPGEHSCARHLSGKPVPVVQHLVVREAGTAPVGQRGQESKKTVATFLRIR